MIQYIANKSRFIIRAAGSFDFSRSIEKSLDAADTVVGEDEIFPEEENVERRDPGQSSAENVEDDLPEVDLASYKPRVENRAWHISETDLEFITIGCYILGTGGGGSPYSDMLHLRSIMRSGGVVKVINPRDLKDDDCVGGGGGGGSRH